MLRMSALGQTRRFEPQSVTSGLPQSTDIARGAQLVRFVPNSEVRVGNRAVRFALKNGQRQPHLPGPKTCTQADIPTSCRM